MTYYNRYFSHKLRSHSLFISSHIILLLIIQYYLHKSCDCTTIGKWFQFSTIWQQNQQQKLYLSLNFQPKPLSFALDSALLSLFWVIYTIRNLIVDTLYWAYMIRIQNITATSQLGLYNSSELRKVIPFNVKTFYFIFIIIFICWYQHYKPYRIRFIHNNTTKQQQSKVDQQTSSLKTIQIQQNLKKSKKIQSQLVKQKKRRIIKLLMRESLQLYISQQLKNTIYRKKHSKRVSSIMTEIKMQARSDSELPDDRMKKLDYIAKEFKNDGGSCRSKNNRSSIKLNKISNLQSGNLRDNKIGNNKFRVRNKTKFKQMHDQQQLLVAKTIRASLQTPRLHIIDKISKKKVKRNKQVPESARYFNIQSQNVHKLNSFIRGAYEINQFSNVVNLNQIDQFRRDFYVYDKLYNSVAQSNIQKKMCLKDVCSQKFKDIVYVNELKDHSTAPQFRQILKQLQIIK